MKKSDYKSMKIDIERVFDVKIIKSNGVFMLYCDTGTGLDRVGTCRSFKTFLVYLNQIARWEGRSDYKTLLNKMLNPAEDKRWL